MRACGAGVGRAGRVGGLCHGAGRALACASDAEDRRGAVGRQAGPRRAGWETGKRGKEGRLGRPAGQGGSWSWAENEKRNIFQIQILFLL